MMRSALILLALAVSLGPFVVLAVNPVRPSDGFLAPGAGFIPADIAFDHDRAVSGGDGETLRFLWNSVVVTVATTGLALVLGAPAAHAPARLRLPFRLGLVFALAFLILRFYPKLTIALPNCLIMRDLGWLETHLAVIPADVSITVPVVVRLMPCFLVDLPREIEQSAMMDGCGAWGRFVRIVLPLSLRSTTRLPSIRAKRRPPDRMATF
jgi:multiple sugar transport system permease protein